MDLTATLRGERVSQVLLAVPKSNFNKLNFIHISAKWWNSICTQNVTIPSLPKTKDQKRRNSWQTWDMHWCVFAFLCFTLFKLRNKQRNVQIWTQTNSLSSYKRDAADSFEFQQWCFKFCFLTFKTWRSGFILQTRSEKAIKELKWRLNSCVLWNTVNIIQTELFFLLFYPLLYNWLL